jgi:hypothetical protein
MSFLKAFSMPGRKTLIATVWPLDLRTALWTCAMDAAAIGSEIF